MIKVVYHGSKTEIRGELIPHPAKDLENHPENIPKAIYATDIKEIAIAAAIIKSKGVRCSRLNKEKPHGTIYKGFPEEKYIYLYTLHSQKFKQEGGHGHQYISKEAVKPIKIEKLKIIEHIHKIKVATEKESKEFFKKHRLYEFSQK